MHVVWFVYVQGSVFWGYSDIVPHLGDQIQRVGIFKQNLLNIN